MKELNIDDSFLKQDIKSEAITENQIDEMRAMAGSYESLFSRSAMKYKALGLKNLVLKEDDYRKYILEEYTFLKRPVFIIYGEIFIGNSKQIVAEIANKLAGTSLS
jgi:arsenate reductase (glutaredoxin)